MKRVFSTTVAAVALAVGFSAPSHASLMLSLSDGTTSVTITDGLIGDLNSAAGAVTFIGAVGSFVTNVATAISYPMLGSPLFPAIDLNSVDVTSSNGGTLTISMTDTGFIGSGGLTNFASSVGGTTTAGTIKLDTFLDCSNSAFGTATPLTSQSFSGPAFSGGAGTTVAGCGGAYSLTQTFTLNLPGGGTVFSGDAHLAVPEPSALASFGVGLLMLAGFGWAYRRRNSF